jgi:hypothetical protein
VALDRNDNIYLMHTPTRRIFIADHGNNRIVSVKLDYHESREVPLPASTRWP